MFKLEKDLELLKNQHPDDEVLPVKIFPYFGILDQISVPNDLPVFHYNQLRLSDCLYTTSRVVKNKWGLFYNTVQLLLNY